MLFVQKFDPNKKDLVYGLTGQRAVYFEAWREYQKRMLTEYKNFGIYNRYYFVNDYNEPISGGKFIDPEDVRLDQNQDMVQREFLDALGETRYSPYDIGGVDRRRLLATGDFANLGIDPGKLSAPQLAELLMLYAVRRACKFGIKYIVNHPTGTLHYILDGITMTDVINKSTMALFTGKIGVPITTSELRFIFRQWHLFRNSSKFIFWKNFKNIEAPWQQTPEDWIPYAVQRVNKYRDRLATGRQHAQLSAFDRAVVQNRHSFAIDLFHDMQITDLKPLEYD